VPLLVFLNERNLLKMLLKNNISIKNYSILKLTVCIAVYVVEKKRDITVYGI